MSTLIFSNDQQQRVIDGSCLSAREKEVLTWLAAGKTNWEISVILGISLHTVKNHVKKIFKKLDVTNRAQATSIAISKNIVTYL